MPLIQSFSGIRGIYNNALDIDTVKRYAYAYYTLLLKNTALPTIIIGRDTRNSGESICKAICDVFSEVINIGIVTTPMCELAVREYNADGGIMITASHNEPEWNGLKFLGENGSILSVESINEVIANYQMMPIKKRIEVNPNSNNVLRSHENSLMKISMHKDIILRYSVFISKIISKRQIDSIRKSRIKLVIDPNGGTGILAEDILKRLNIKYSAINNNLGVFERVIEPTEESLKGLLNTIKVKGYDIGFGFDCDADRVEVVYNNGILSGHYLLALILDYILSKLKNPEKQTVVVNDATSGIVRWVANKYNSTIIETDVGEINVVEGMNKYNSIIGGEGSSSGIIISPSMCRDGILTMLYVLVILSERNLKIQDVIKEFPRYTTLRKDIDIKSSIPPYLMDSLLDYYKNKGYRVKSSQSIKVFINEHSFIWFRISRTENNKLRIIADSDNKELANKLVMNSVMVVKRLLKNANKKSSIYKRG